MPGKKRSATPPKPDRPRRTSGPSRRRGVRFQVPPWLRKGTAWTAWGYLILVGFTAAFIWTQGDNWWPATVLLYGPRWLLLLPALPLALAAVLIRPLLLLPVGAAVLVTLGPTMGFRTGWRGWITSDPPRSLRVITFNLQGHSNPMLRQVPGELEHYGADVVVFQECPEQVAYAGLWPAGWTAQVTTDGFCLASRFPIAESKVLERLETQDQSGTGNAALFRLRADFGTIDFVVLHLETPRQGLAPLRSEGSASALRGNIVIRAAGARRISRWIQSETTNPVIAGDLNLPVESRIYRDFFGHCANAFSITGRGFGWTRVLKNRFSIRIDHVLACGTWRPIHTEVGPDLGSDHLPVIVDLGIAR